MTIVQTETTTAKTGRSLVDPKLFDRMAARIAIEYGMDRPLAERVMDQALAFLFACATATTALKPSKLVDVGWHTFVLYTQEYAEFCDRVAGRFIHHIPDDGDGAPEARSADPWQTTAAIVAAGYVVDAPMWEREGNCSQCHNGCSDDPPPDPK